MVKLPNKNDFKANDINKNTYLKDSQSLHGRQLLMDVLPKIRERNVPLVVRRAIADSENGQAILHQVGLGSGRKFPSKNFERKLI
jgi:hypothetical protein